MYLFELYDVPLMCFLFVPHLTGWIICVD